MQRRAELSTWHWLHMQAASLTKRCSQAYTVRQRSRPCSRPPCLRLEDVFQAIHGGNHCRVHPLLRRLIIPLQHGGAADVLAGFHCRAETRWGNERPKQHAPPKQMLDQQQPVAIMGARQAKRKARKPGRQHNAAQWMYLHWRWLRPAHARPQSPGSVGIGAGSIGGAKQGHTCSCHSSGAAMLRALLLSAGTHMHATAQALAKCRIQGRD